MSAIAEATLDSCAGLCLPPLLSEYTWLLVQAWRPTASQDGSSLEEDACQGDGLQERFVLSGSMGAPLDP